MNNLGWRNYHTKQSSRWLGSRGLGPLPGVLAVGVLLTLLHSAQAAVFSIPPGDVDALINAINTANSNGGNDTIHLAAGTYALTAVDNDTDGPNGLPSITSPITITGQGADRTQIVRVRDVTTPLFRLLHIAGSGVLRLQGLRLSQGAVAGDDHGGGIFNRGRLTLTRSTVHSNSSDFRGGGIVNHGTLRLTSSTVSDNVVTGGGASGGILNFGTAEIVRSTISNNLAEAAVGIDNDGMLTLTNSTVSGNQSGASGGAGGGITNSGTMQVANSTISGNQARFGGGGIANFGTLDVTNSTISGNFVSSEPGFQAGGGGISNTGTLTLSHSTITANEDEAAGGDGGGGGLRNRGIMELTQTIVAGNTADEATVADCGGDTSSSLTSIGHNLVGVGTGCPSDGPGDQTVNPAQVFTTVLGPLQDNGGPTDTHALLPGSPAIDMGQSAPCGVVVDQRGISRPQGLACDIGAVEFGEFHGAPSSVYQAEDADVGGGSRVESNHSGFNGTGFVDFSPSGGFVEWTGVDGGSGGPVLIALRYALGAGTARTVTLTINGTTKGVTFQPTGGWDRWRYKYIQVNLRPGVANTIGLLSVGGNDSGNIDELVLGLQAEDALVDGGSRVASNHPGFRGTGFVDFADQGGVVEWLHVDGRNGGAIRLTFRYALGINTPRTAELIVNGSAQPLRFRPTGGWTSWATVTVRVVLKPGLSNTVRVESTGNDAGNLDQLFVTN